GGREPAERRQAAVEAAQDVVEQTVHLAVQRQERVAVAEDGGGPVAVVAAPGNQIAYAHCLSPSCLRARLRPGAGANVRLLRSRHRGSPQAACFPASIRPVAVPPLPISIRRGFISSGISRLRSIVSRPFSRTAPVTFTWSANWKRRWKVRPAMPRCRYSPVSSSALWPLTMSTFCSWVIDSSS